MGLILFSEKIFPITYEIKYKFIEKFIMAVRERADVFRLNSRKPFYLFV